MRHVGNPLSSEPMNMTDKFTTALAVGAIPAPYWINILDNANHVMAFIASLLGIIWLLTQIYKAWRT